MFCESPRRAPHRGIERGSPNRVLPPYMRPSRFPVPLTADLPSALRNARHPDSTHTVCRLWVQTTLGMVSYHVPFRSFSRSDDDFGWALGTQFRGLTRTPSSIARVPWSLVNLLPRRGRSEAGGRTAFMGRRAAWVRCARV